MYEFDLGAHHRPVKTESKVAQDWVNVGLVWMFGYNHDEAIACFEHALEADPGIAFAWWGIAYAIGPNYNKPWDAFDLEERAAALAKAEHAITRGLAIKDATPIEKALLNAITFRYPKDPESEDCSAWTERFASEMKTVFDGFSDDLDIVAIWAEAQMNRTPWALWDLAQGTPAKGSSTVEVQQTLERTFDTIETAWDHPGLLHFYIHLMEMSPTPELALPHGDRLLGLVPDAGHLVHMATHIDVLCGHYQAVVERNASAVQADMQFAAHAGHENFYTLYRLHNLHFQVYGAMFAGMRRQAHAAAQGLRAILSNDVVAYLPEFFEAFVGMDLHVHVRFGEWSAILEMPLPHDPALYLCTTALQRYARTVAFANLGRIEEARSELSAYFDAIKAMEGQTRWLFNNEAKDILAVATDMAQGELAYKSGAIEKGFAHLKAAVDASETLTYDEPWGWMQPPRHALAALLMDQSQFEDAERAYRADLGLDQSLPRPHQHPNNVWALHGLNDCLKRRGDITERRHIEHALKQSVARADVPITASCFCSKAAARA